MSILDTDDILKNTFQLLKDSFGSMIMNQESKGSMHIHALLASEKIITQKQIVVILKTLYPELGGNKTFSCVIARNRKSLASYVIKESDEYLYTGFTNDIVKAFKKLSYNLDAFSINQKKLIERIELRQITLSRYCVEHVQLKADHHQPLYPAAIRAHCTSVGVKTGYLTAESLARHILGDYYESWDIEVRPNFDELPDLEVEND